MSERVRSEQLSGGQSSNGGRISRLRQWLRRPVGWPGYEWDALLFVVKGTLAAALSWVVAYYLIGAEFPAFAPFSTILILQVTIYQSVVQSLRYVGAIAAGVAVQGVIVLLAGPDLVAFVLVALVALGLSRLPQLGPQRAQISTAAFFAFSAYVAATDEIQGYLHLGEIVLLVAVGCVLGILVNLLVFPPLRYRTAEHGVRTAGSAMSGILQDMAPAVRDGVFYKEHTEQWHTRAIRLSTTISQARASIQTAWESILYNPRRVLRRSGPSHKFQGYSNVLDALERLSRQITAITDDATRIGHTQREEEQNDTGNDDETASAAEDRYDEDENGNENGNGNTTDSAGRDGTDRASPKNAADTKSGRNEDSFYHIYGRFLGAVGEALNVIAEVDEERLTEQQATMRDRVDEAAAWQERLRSCRVSNGVTESVAAESEIEEVMIVDAARLMEELRTTGDTFGSCAGPVRTQRQRRGRRGRAEPAP